MTSMIWEEEGKKKIKEHDVRSQVSHTHMSTGYGQQKPHSYSIATIYSWTQAIFHRLHRSLQQFNGKKAFSHPTEQTCFDILDCTWNSDRPSRHIQYCILLAISIKQHLLPTTCNSFSPLLMCLSHYLGKQYFSAISCKTPILSHSSNRVERHSDTFKRTKMITFVNTLL